VEADTRAARAPAGACQRQLRACARICAAALHERGAKRALTGSIRADLCRYFSYRLIAPGAIALGRSFNKSTSRRERSRPVSRVLSRTTIHLRYASPRTCSDLPGSTCGPHARPRSEDPCRLPPYLVLLRAGFAVPPSVATGAVRSYRTISPLPATPSLPSPALRVRDRAGRLWRFAFCCTFRGLTPPRCYLAPCPGSPDFPPRLRAAVVWPTPSRDGGGEHAKAQAVIRDVWARPE
jgi:hypothetical protein